VVLGPVAFSQRTRARARPLLRHMVGDVLRRTRLEQGRTLADVARDARVSLPYLSELERGRKEASSEVLAAICDALRIELSDLLARVGRDLARDGARQPSVIRPGPVGNAAGTPRPASPRADADGTPVLAGISDGSADVRAEPCELPIDLADCADGPAGIADGPAGIADGPAGAPHASATLLRSPARAGCLLAA
jgi:DNA-binding Xre family transcriptional regulator